jgi:hypothetical protein
MKEQVEDPFMMRCQYPRVPKKSCAINEPVRVKTCSKGIDHAVNILVRHERLRHVLAKRGTFLTE